MLQYAQLSIDNFVIQINLVNESSCLTIEGEFNDGLCINHLKQLYGQDTRWVRSYPDGEFRKRPAQSGYKYDPQLDAFIEPVFFPSWTFDEETLSYVPPTPKPIDGKDYIWNEEKQQWIEYTEYYKPSEPMPDYDVE